MRLCSLALSVMLSVALLLQSACSSGTGQQAGAVLPKQEMIRILADIQLAEATAEVKQTVKDTSVFRIAAYYQYIFDQHKTNLSTFEKSYRYYADHPKEMDEIYQGVIDELTARQTDMKNKKGK